MMNCHFAQFLRCRRMNQPQIQSCRGEEVSKLLLLLRLKVPVQVLLSLYLKNDLGYL